MSFRGEDALAAVEADKAAAAGWQRDHARPALNPGCKKNPAEAVFHA